MENTSKRQRFILRVKASLITSVVCVVGFWTMAYFVSDNFRGLAESFVKEEDIALHFLMLTLFVAAGASGASVAKIKLDSEEYSTPETMFVAHAAITAALIFLLYALSFLVIL